MPFLDTRHKKKSFTLATLLLSAVLLLLFYIGLTYLDPPEEKGIAINFGTTDFGSGEVQPKEKIKSEELNVPNEPEVAEATAELDSPAEQVVTQDNEESIRIRQQKQKKQRAEAEAKRKKAAENRKRAEQEAKKRKLDALVGGIGKSNGTDSGSEGDDNRAGDKGNPNGNPYATSYYGAPGSGNRNGKYGLNGRVLKGSNTVKPDCNEEGRVVVKVVVGRDGKVKSVKGGVKGSTNTAPCLIGPAEKTARLHKWNADSKAPSQQIGFVVVDFKLQQ